MGTKAKKIQKYGNRNPGKIFQKSRNKSKKNLGTKSRNDN
jgi:hypothetical protein